MSLTTFTRNPVEGDVMIAIRGDLTEWECLTEAQGRAVQAVVRGIGPEPSREVPGAPVRATPLPPPGVEAWATIPGYDGYEASSHARLRRYWVTRMREGDRRPVRVRVAEPRPVRLKRDEDGRLVATLVAGRHKETRQIGYWMLTAFVGPRPSPRWRCAHWPDPDPTRNELGNLRWQEMGAGGRGDAEDDHERHPAWSRVEDLTRAGHDADTIESLVDSEPPWLVACDLPGGRVVTLTPWAAERLRVETRDYWEYVDSVEPPPKAKKSKDALAEPDRPVRVENLVELPRWVPAPPPREPGSPRPPKVCITLPERHHTCRLPDWLDPRWANKKVVPKAAVSKEMSPLDELIAQEELERKRYVVQEKVKEDGSLEVDQETGRVKLERLKIQGQEVPRKRKPAKRGKHRRKPRPKGSETAVA